MSISTNMSVIPITSTNTTVITTPVPTIKGLITAKITSILPITTVSKSDGSKDEAANGPASRPSTKLGSNITLVNGSTSITSIVPSTSIPTISKALIIPHITIAATGPPTAASPMAISKNEAVSTPSLVTISSVKPCRPSISLIRTVTEPAKPIPFPVKLTAVTHKTEVDAKKAEGASASGGSTPKKSVESSDAEKPRTTDAVSAVPKSNDYDPVKELDWKDGIATLPGSNFKFRLNEFGVMEIVNDVDSSADKLSDKPASGKASDKPSDQLAANKPSDKLTPNNPSDKPTTSKLMDKSVPSKTEDKPTPGKPADKSADKPTSESTTVNPATPVVKEIKDESTGTSEQASPKVSEVKSVRNRKQLLCQRDESMWKNEIECMEAFTQDEDDDLPNSDKEMTDPATIGNAYDVLRCQHCRQYGLALDFVKSGRFCSVDCASEFNKTKHLPRVFKDPPERKKKPAPAETTNVENSVEPKKTGKPRGRPLGAKGVKKPENSFCWQSYLDEIRAIAAPVKLFKDPFPGYKNGFRVGMKMEGIDPGHPSMFCVLTVAEVCGFRCKMHFDGYSESFDFWVNADSIDLLPVGWCEKMGHKLNPPKGFTQQTFNWGSYLKLAKAQAAPKHLFTNKTYNAVSPHGFRVGMKLEAVDKKNSSLVCVATVTDVMDNRFLVHFDGWDDIYDYWADPTSPYIHPVGWCEENGHILTPPNNYKNPTHFTWASYFAMTKSQAAPARAFKLRPASGFKPGMRLEAVDRRNPSLIRVASIVDVANHEIKINFTNWDEAFDYWIDDDSPDIHPTGWCAKTGHPLQPPPTIEDLLTPALSGCPTPGCKGMGHIKGPKFTSHHSAFGCPYSELNAGKEAQISDRMHGGSKEFVNTEFKKVSLDLPHSDGKKCPTPGCSGLGHITGKFSAHRRASGCPLLEKNRLKALKDGSLPPELMNFSNGKRKRRLSGDDQSLAKEMRMSSDSSDSSSSFFPDSSAKCSPSISPSLKRMNRLNVGSDLIASVHQSIFLPQANFSHNPNMDLTSNLNYQSKLLPSIAHHRGQDIHRWKADEVANFVYSLPGCDEVAKIFIDEQIDGEAFLLLTQADIVKLMNIKLGPALKIYNSILMLHAPNGDS